ncbi:MAG: hypothetical protein ABIH23_26230 [bacterium]
MTSRFGWLSVFFVVSFLCLYAPQASETKSGIEIPEGVVVDQSADTLVIPEALRDSDGFDVAETPSTLRFSVVKGCVPIEEGNQGTWSSWGEPILASDGNYYTSVGNHCGVDGLTYIIRYNPDTGEQTRVFDSYVLFDHQPGTYGHGKLHGRLDEYPRGYLIAATYWGIPPLSTKYKGEFFTGPIPGGRLIRVNIAKGTTEDLGVPFERDSWPMFATDTKRGIFYAIGYDRHFLAYDFKTMQPLYAALPPANIAWFERATLVDEKTGCCYSTSQGRFVKYDPATNKITFLKSLVPLKPNEKPEEHQNIRCYTRSRTKDGCFLAQSFTGMIFKFFPDTDTVEPVDVNWGQGYYCTSMALSPGERYLYYTVDVHGSSYTHGCPVVQYDLQKKRRKVIAFLHPYYADNYKYIFGGSYAVLRNTDGSQIFITWNGKFREGKDKGESFGDPSLMLIDVPASERVE